MVIVGIYLIYASWKNPNIFLKILGPIAILIGLSSFFYHASWTLLGEFFDLGSMFLLSAWLITFNINRLRPNINKRFLAILFGGIFAFSIVVLYFTKFTGGFEYGKYIFAIEILVALILECAIYKKEKGQYKINNFAAALVILLVAFFIWYLDRARVGCNPATAHIFNGHALWHFLNGVIILFVYRFYVKLVK